MKKRIFVFILLMFIFPLMANAGGSSDDSILKKTCEYATNRISVYIKIYNDKITSTGFLIVEGEKIQYHSEREIGNDSYDEYITEECPNFVLVTYPGHDDKKMYISNDENDLELIINDKSIIDVDFEQIDVYKESGEGTKVLGQILKYDKSEDIKTPTTQTDDTFSCIYSSEIDNCNDCEIEIVFFKKSTSYKVGESCVKSYNVNKGEIDTISFEGDSWIKKEMNTSLKQEIIPFATYLPNGVCPKNLFFQYDNKILKIHGSYLDADKEDGTIDNNIGELPVITGKVTCETLFMGYNNDYNATYYLLKNIIKFMQYIAITLALILSIVDFVKVIPSQDKALLKKSATKAAKRLIFAIIVFFVPIILDYFLDIVGITNSTCGLL